MSDEGKLQKQLKKIIDWLFGRTPNDNWQYLDYGGS